eukprot:TRINITY_DN13618_c0_g1::TRINITY_DN13618_c0_g1_i1::g.22167::m.22167 TRINITY_DN13618_c0_g1::TRINITY_DN13618_c0_g1_i1::g.22167  ORF type:complete len:131 (-),score=11.12,sp/Q8LFQ6/GRXC4_ARATH/46.46/5e-27,Glutaredoxin/PF00462.19/2.6e-19,GST_N_2/PF13409.1/0.0016,GST_N_3/PF13417.1/0.0018,DUF836/PF05768.9/0.0036,Thioredoxin_2/PF13098.1/0.0092,OTT_1508_deam/PF14441.1/0.02,Thioredoxin_3/PF13192.1/0.16,Toxin_1/PF00087.16/0.22,Toxin_1/PF00087.16/2.4e+03 TRINITY_DN13618_c0_g1_i1:65-424(-)
MGQTQSQAFTSKCPPEDKVCYVNEVVTEFPVVVFSKSSCPYCDKAKSALAKSGVNARIIELDQRPDGYDIQQACYQLTGRQTVPNVFVGGKSIGGGDDTVSLYQSGQLEALLKAAGAKK